ncbi:MAG: CBS domain-containing protein [Candidatus Melainabacteria bacterium]|nr:CBS domain-containing protein [Candidatus Melainabacteria bacterium]MBI3307762.1 CBS domain-containing protein [Candidatus Melainabacteria bacterium]
MLVKDVMNLNPYLLHEEDTILYASKFMKEERIRNLPVVDKENKLIGLLTLREIIETIYKNPDKILVKDSMIKIVETVDPDMPLKNAINVMIENKYGALPVIRKDKTLVGMITEQYLLKTLYKLETTQKI